MEQIRFNASLEAARLMAEWLDRNPHADAATRLSGLAYHVLEAIYQSENDLADDPLTLVVCTGCFGLLRVRRGIAGNKEKCPRCGHALRLPEIVACN